VLELAQVLLLALELGLVPVLDLGRALELEHTLVLVLALEL